MAAACGLASAAMFVSRPFCEPILRLVLALFLRHFQYDPGLYWFFTMYVAVGGLLILLATAYVVLRKRSQDRSIDNALRRRTTEIAQGAPLEPK